MSTLSGGEMELLQKSRVSMPSTGEAFRSEPRNDGPLDIWTTTGDLGQSWTVSDTCVRCQPAPSLRWVHFRWESARSRIGEDLVALLERLIASGAYRPGPVPFRRPLFIDRHGVAYFHQYLPIDQLLPRRSPTEAAVARAEDGISRGVGRLPVVVLLEAYGAGTVVENAEYFEATRRQGFDVVRCWVRLGLASISDHT